MPVIHRLSLVLALGPYPNIISIILLFFITALQMMAKGANSFFCNTFIEDLLWANT